MRAPDGLGATGKAAWAQARAALAEQTVPEERFEEAARRYALAVDRVARLNREWTRLKRPLLAKGGTTGKVTVPHPLIAMIESAEKTAARAGAALGLDPQSRKAVGAVRGRPQERVPERGAGEPPKLVAV